MASVSVLKVTRYEKIVNLYIRFQIPSSVGSDKVICSVPVKYQPYNGNLTVPAQNCWTANKTAAVNLYNNNLVIGLSGAEANQTYAVSTSWIIS